MRALFLIVTAILFRQASISSAVLTPVDQTIVAGASGFPVVDAVIENIREKCFFDYKPNLFLFMRRLAFVQTKYGTGNWTFTGNMSAEGNGIWQVNTQKVLSAQSIYNSYAAAVRRKK